MKQKRRLLIVLLALILLIGGAGILYRTLGEKVDMDRLGEQTAQEAGENRSEENGSDPEETAEDRPKAPDFTVYDGEGNAVHLTDYAGKPIVLNFWASWCGSCRSHMPVFQEKYDELGEDVTFLMINMTDGRRETVDTAAEYLETDGYTFPVLFDTEANAAYTYGAYALPVTYFIDAEGYGVVMASGPLDAETMQKGIDLIT